MPIKDLFNKKSTSISTKAKSAEDFSEIESLDLATEKRKTELRFSPQVDFEDPSQFARYGLAEKYYKDSIEYICKSYPYDGSFYEKQKWHNESSDLVNYFFDNNYPRNNGFIKIGENYGTSSISDDNYYSSSVNEFIFFKGTYNDGNTYNLEKNREYNLKIDGDEGNTVEFYFKRDNLSGSHKQIILDVWNNEVSSSSDYGRMMIEVHPGISGEEDKIYFQISSGSNGYTGFELGNNLDFTGSWHHYAVSYQNSGSTIKAQLLVDGDVVDTQSGGTTIGRIYGAMQGQIGSLITAASGTVSERGWGKLSGSLDEFRFWKKKRTDKEIALNYFTTIGGGTNTDDANTNLGVYYKFNEGIYDTNNVSSFDKIVLDYSGRISNGAWTGYSVGSRSTRSAIVLSGLANKEFKDPIVYIKHPDVTSLAESYSSIGYEYDIRNNASIYNSLPAWKIEEDQENGESTKNLMQIMSEVFDDIHNKIKYLPTIRDVEYRGENPLSFSSRLLQNSGLEFSDIFNDVETIELFLDRNEKENYENKIYKIKNIIYQNIYNNLANIYKTKGTTKSFRNLLHCFGVGQDLLKMQMYADNTEFEINEKLRQSFVKKTSISFNNTSSYGGVIYQEENSEDSNSISFIKASSDIMSLGNTLEVEMFFPKKFEINDPLFNSYPYYTASLFGTHEDDSGLWAATDRADLQVFAVRHELEDRDVYFQLSSSYLGINVTSDTIKDVYDDTKWNFALRVRPKKYPLSENISGTSNDDYVVELYGTSYVQDVKQNSFIISGNVDNATIEDYFLANKKIYIGAHRQDFSGSIVATNSEETSKQFSDVEVFSARFWNSYLQNDTIDLHSKTTNVYGAKDLEHKTSVQQFALQNNIVSASLEQNLSLSLHWNYLNPEIESGEFTLLDAASGSIELANDGYMSDYIYNSFTGYGKHFAPEKEKVVRTRFINTAEMELPENISPDDLIQIIGEYEDLFERERKFVDYYYVLEKSFYNVISKEMIAWLGTVKEFNNLLGNPKNRYRENYEGLELLRTLFFRNVENEPDFNKFVTFYKWIDDSVSSIVENLVPASMKFNPSVMNIVESHALERNKYRHKLPTVEFIGDPPVSTFRGVNELLYDWKYGHAPLSGLESEHCNWWAERAERTGSLNSERSGIFEVIKQSVNRNFGTVYSIGSEGRMVIGRPQKPSMSGFILTKNSQQDIIINEAGFDLSGVEFVEISDIIPLFDDCDDE